VINSRRWFLGFKIVTLGISIDGILYPLYFDFVRQKTKKEGNLKQKMPTNLSTFLY